MEEAANGGFSGGDRGHALILRSLATIAAQRQEHDKALSKCDEALRILQRNRDADDALIGEIQFFMAWLCCEHVKKNYCAEYLQRAQAYMKEGLAIYKVFLIAEHPKFLGHAADFVGLCCEMADFDTAKSFLDDWLATVEPSSRVIPLIEEQIERVVTRQGH